ncbi:hypothetical protein M513_12417 [Trichuris suis]|uniref:Uncharacterized protein n=1 Tax=Trichuris suis TaxID=68888 RepID=A0A085LP11_9BILA|nr:hypothetical protein M513_12417 [Trichuris suis]
MSDNRMHGGPGLTVSLLPEALLHQHFGEVPLLTPTKVLTTYTRSPLPTVGCLLALASYNGKTTSACFYVVSAGMPLVGMDITAPLQIAVRGAHICPNVKPVQQNVRRLPLSIKDSVSEDLQRLLHEGIIERADASEWISPIVVMQKKSGGIRLRVNNVDETDAAVSSQFSETSELQGWHQVSIATERTRLTSQDADFVTGLLFRIYRFKSYRLIATVGEKLNYDRTDKTYRELQSAPTGASLRSPQ